MLRMDRDLTQVRPARVTRITAVDWLSASGARVVGSTGLGRSPLAIALAVTAVPRHTPD
jgi:hypothetical protein